MMTYILTFFAGMIVGISLLVWHQYSIRRATERLTDEYRMRRELSRLRAENEELRDTVNAAERCDEMRHVRQQGYNDGKQRGMNMRQFEVLESTLSGDGRRNVRAGGGGPR